MTTSSNAFVHFFKILIFWVVSGVKVQKISQKDKKFCLSCLAYQEPYRAIVIYDTKVSNDNISRHFFIFSKFWFFGLIGGSKGKKMTQNNKKVCPLHFISQEPYIIWPWFMVHICKRIMSPGVLNFYQILIFLVISWRKEQKMAKMTKNYVILWHTSCDCAFCCASLKWWHLQRLFSFFQMFGFLRS